MRIQNTKTSKEFIVFHSFLIRRNKNICDVDNAIFVFVADCDLRCKFYQA